MQVEEEIYIMTTDDKKTIVGQLVVREKELWDELQMLRSKASASGRAFEVFGRSLQGHAENVVFEGEPIDLRFTANNFRQNDLDIVTTKKVCEKMRIVMLEHSTVLDELEKLGYRVAH